MNIAAQQTHNNAHRTPCCATAIASIESSMEQLERVLSQIDDPSARKIVVMSKWQRGEIVRAQAEQLIRHLGLVNA